MQWVAHELRAETHNARLKQARFVELGVVKHGLLRQALSLFSRALHSHFV